MITIAVQMCKKKDYKVYKIKNNLNEIKIV